MLRQVDRKAGDSRGALCCECASAFERCACALTQEEGRSTVTRKSPDNKASAAPLCNDNVLGHASFLSHLLFLFSGKPSFRF